MNLSLDPLKNPRQNQKLIFNHAKDIFQALKLYICFFIGMPMYCHAFLEHEISGAELMSLEKSDFKDVGVSKV